MEDVGVTTDDPLLDAALGCALGALCGDAAGAPLERLGRAPSNAEVRASLCMCGGGTLQTARGQVTDDGEMTLCGLWAACAYVREHGEAEEAAPRPATIAWTTLPALTVYNDLMRANDQRDAAAAAKGVARPDGAGAGEAEGDAMVAGVDGDRFASTTTTTSTSTTAATWKCGDGTYWDETVAQCYARWVLSQPFDMGITIGSSIGSVLKPNAAFARLLAQHGYAACMRRAATFSVEGRTSKANGAAMRVVPQALLCHRLGLAGHTEAVEALVWADCSLSHPHPTVVACNVALVLAIAHLLHHHGDASGAHAVALEWARTTARQRRSAGAAEAAQWLKEAQDNRPVAFWPQAGYIRIAFIHAFRHLLLGSTYGQAMYDVLKGGGDTDTNACIVGALVGARTGASGIPEPMTSTVLACDTSDGRPRPSFLHACHVPAMVRYVVARAPKQGPVALAEADPGEVEGHCDASLAPWQRTQPPYFGIGDDEMNQ